MRWWYLARSAPWLLLAGRRLKRWIRQAKPDVVLFTQLPAVRYFGRILAAQDVALTFYVQGGLGAHEIGTDVRRLLRDSFARVLACSHSVAGFLREAGIPDEKLEVVHNGVDLARVRLASEQAPNPPLPHYPDDAVVFLQVGTLLRDVKAQHLSVAALAHLPEQAHLWLVGDVPERGSTAYRDELIALAAKLNVSDRVHLLGWRQDVPAVFRAADVCVLPSVVPEGLPLTLGEAMALGKPCIGSNLGGTPEIIADGETGLVCDPTVAALAAAMRKLLQTPELRARMGAAGRARAEQRFSIAYQSTAVGNIFRALASSRPDRR